MLELPVHELGPKPLLALPPGTSLHIHAAPFITMPGRFVIMFSNVYVGVQHGPCAQGPGRPGRPLSKRLTWLT